MKTLSVEYPESILAAENRTPESFEAEARVALAMKLYEMGRLTSGQAAVLAGVPRVTFLLRCQEFGVWSVEWDRAEFEAELEEVHQ